MTVSLQVTPWMCQNIIAFFGTLKFNEVQQQADVTRSSEMAFFIHFGFIFPRFTS